MGRHTATALRVVVATAATPPESYLSFSLSRLESKYSLWL